MLVVLKEADVAVQSMGSHSMGSHSMGSRELVAHMVAVLIKEDTGAANLRTGAGETYRVANHGPAATGVRRGGGA